MSGRPDPAARWGAADSPAEGDPRDGDAGSTASTADAVTGVRNLSSREASGTGRVAEPRTDRDVPGPPDAGGAGATSAAAAGATAAADAAADDAKVGNQSKVATGANGAGTILTDVAALTAERDDYLQSLQRLKADFDNYRKRVARLQEEQASRAAAGLVQKLLPVLDNLDLAVAHLVKDEPETEDVKALAQARAQLLDVLAKEGLERVDATEVPFDPTVHDAVAHTAAAPATGPERSDAGDGDASVADAEASVGSAAPAAVHETVVDEVMRAGYRWRGQVLRPAMVRVRG